MAQYQKSRRLGKASVKDLLDAENDLIYARNLELNAVENFAYLVARLWKDIGVLLERQNIHIDTSNPDEVTADDIPINHPDDRISAAVAKAMVVPEITTAGHPDAPVKQKTKTIKNLASAPVKGSDLSGPRAAVKQSGQTSVRTSAEKASSKNVAGTSTYTLKIGEYLASELDSVKKKIAKGGLVAVVKNGLKQDKQVFRLFVRDCQDMASAKHALEPLANTHCSSFILKNAEHQYDAYAGSFFTQERAEAEQKRLAARGVTVVIKKVSVQLPAFLLTAGSFTSREDAMEWADKLRKQGLPVELLQS